MSPILELRAAARSFSQGGLFGRSATVRAVDGVSLSIMAGEIALERQGDRAVRCIHPVREREAAE
jgi:hypothetical protein